MCWMRMLLISEQTDQIINTRKNVRQEDRECFPSFKTKDQLHWTTTILPTFIYNIDKIVLVQRSWSLVLKEGKDSRFSF